MLILLRILRRLREIIHKRRDRYDLLGILRWKEVVDEKMSGLAISLSQTCAHVDLRPGVKLVEPKARLNQD